MAHSPLSLRERRVLCPHCSVPLAPATNGTVSLAICWKCRGIWLQKDSFAQISRGREHGASLLGAAKHQEKRQLMMRTIRCPICLYRMAPVNFANCSSVVIDVCQRHGTWLDAGELQQINDFITLRQIAGTKQIAGGKTPVASGAAFTVGAAALISAPSENKTVRQQTESASGWVWDLAEGAVDVLSDIPLEGVVDVASGLLEGLGSLDVLSGLS